jgi:uncharacterized protein
MSLPTQIDPRKLALQGITLEGEFFAEDLPRLSASVEAVNSSLSATLQFAVDESRQPLVKGEAKISVDVICQRCLDPMSIEIKAAIALQVILSEDHIHNVSPDYEPWIVVDKIADLAVAIEDELLLALPIVSYHDIDKCTGTAVDSRASTNEEETVSDSPFSILKQLKQ